MKILFMGTPDFAASVLERICENTHDTVVAVLTQPDKDRGRHGLAQPPVKKLAIEKGITVYQNDTLRDHALLPLLEELSPDLIIVAAYGKILPSYILDFPKYGCINVHGSLLPKYRGAAPIQRCIIDGEKVTGITIMKMAQGLDTGDMLLKKSVEITDEDNFESLHDKLALCAGNCIQEAIELIRSGKDVYEKQDDTLACYAEKITREDCLISFDSDAVSIHNRIRGLSPIPLSFSYIDSKMIKFTSSVVCDTESAHTDSEIGRIISDENGMITVACRKGSIGITGVLPEGKKRMPASDFISGRQDLTGKIFTDT